MKIVSAKQMQHIDKKAIECYGIPTNILMENAGIVSAYTVLKMLKVGQDKVLIFAGPGNNGGDGFVCARHLINRGLKVKVCLAGKKTKLPAAAKLNFEILCRLGRNIVPYKLPIVKTALTNADLIVDALFGIGLSSQLRQPYYSLVNLINSSPTPVLSLDVPSGLDATTGRVWGRAIRAKQTITFGALKQGLLNPQAKQWVGRLAVGDICLPRKLLK